MRRTADSIEENKARNVSPENSHPNSGKGKRGDGERIKAWRFQPGRSGNPGGRPKNDLAKEIAQAVFERNPEMIYAAFCKAILKGNAYTFKELAERAYGKLPEPKEILHKYAKVPDGDLQQRMDAILKELGLVRQINEEADKPEEAVCEEISGSSEGPKKSPSQEIKPSSKPTPPHLGTPVLSADSTDGSEETENQGDEPK